MVTLVLGRLKPPVVKLDCTRSSDSFTAASGNPTRTTLGSPRSPLLASTATGIADIPNRVAECVWESMKVREK